MCLNHPCYERLNRFAASKPARIFYGALLVIIVTVTCWRLLQASDKLQVQREREASRLEVIPNTKDGLIFVRTKDSNEVLKASIERSLMPYKSQNTLSNLQTCSYENPISSDKICAVDPRSFGPCNAENDYGFNKASPCVFIKFKKLNDWMPKRFNLSALPKEMPKDIKDRVKTSNNQNIWLSCEGNLPVDVENVGKITYYPDQGYPGFFFPYTGQKDYLEPVLAVNFERPISGVVIGIKCSVWSGDFHDSIKFDLMVDLN